MLKSNVLKERLATQDHAYIYLVQVLVLKEFYEARLTLLNKQLKKLSVSHKSFRSMSHSPDKPIR